MIELVRSMTGDHPARPVLVASNDPQGAAIGAAASGDLGGALIGGALGTAAGALIGSASRPNECVYRDSNGSRYVAACPRGYRG